MDILSVRNALKTKSIYDLEMRVTFYARVSTESEEQKNSLVNQVSYYTDFIKNNTNWTFVPGYVDKGLTGIQTKSREDFNRMINDARSKKFDFIVTKEISRFARNTLDSIKNTRDLLSFGVGVLFQEDGINTFDADSELRLTIMAALAQDEVRKLSSRVKFGHKQAIKKGVVLGNGRMYGYDKIKEKPGVLVVNEKEAEMVRRLFVKYASGDYSLKNLEDLFYAEGYRNRNGGAINHATLANIIRNPKYKGYYVGNKVRIVDMFTKEQRFLDEEDWVMYKDDTGEVVPDIVSEDVWEQANSILRTRSNDVKKRQNKCNHSNLLTGKMYCARCGTLYHRKMSVDTKGNKNSRWACSTKLRKGAHTCPSMYIFEEEIKPLLFEAFSESALEFDQAYEKYEKLFREQKTLKGLDAELIKEEKNKESIIKRKQKLLSYNVDGRLSDDDFLSMNEHLSEELKQCDSRIFDLQQTQRGQDNPELKLKEIKTVMESAKKAAKINAITPEFVASYIDRIDVISQDGGAILDIRLKTSQTSRKSIVRPGSIFLKIDTGETMGVVVKEGVSTPVRASIFGNKIEVSYKYRIILPA